MIDGRHMSHRRYDRILPAVRNRAVGRSGVNWCLVAVANTIIPGMREAAGTSRAADTLTKP